MDSTGDGSNGWVFARGELLQEDDCGQVISGQEYIFKVVGEYLADFDNLEEETTTTTTLLRDFRARLVRRDLYFWLNKMDLFFNNKVHLCRNPFCNVVRHLE